MAKTNPFNAIKMLIEEVKNTAYETPINAHEIELKSQLVPITDKMRIFKYIVLQRVYRFGFQ